LKELIDAVLGESALRNQKEYLKKTPKPEKMTVKQWINRIKNINSYLPLMKPNARAFTEEDLINEVITPNIPSIWEKDFRLANLHLKTRIKEIIEPLTVIEEQVKSTNQGQNPSKKNLKNPCRIHNGGHEWDDCRQDPTTKVMGKTKLTMIAIEMSITTTITLGNKDVPRALPLAILPAVKVTAKQGTQTAITNITQLPTRKKRGKSMSTRQARKY
jgi:hypothetical protein